MVREDIFGMLKTALERGKNLNQTAQSLINSGYARNEVDAAVKEMQKKEIEDLEKEVLETEERLRREKAEAEKKRQEKITKV